LTETGLSGRPRIAVLVSGTGTNLQALIEAVEIGTIPAAIAVVLSDRPGVAALARAQAAGIPAVVCDRAVYGSRVSGALSRAIPDDVRLVVLAGFLSILTEPLLDRFRRRIINIHPALLPRHGGPGMYGLHVHEAVLDAGDPETGCTVHFVDAGTDTGETLLQRTIPVIPGESAPELARRLLPVEHEAIVEATRIMVQDRMYESTRHR